MKLNKNRIQVLYNIIRNRPVAVLAHGKSLETLEKNIQQYKHLDICWVSLNLFTMVEDFILKKINKQLDIVLDCASVAVSFYQKYNAIRIPRLDSYLNRTNNNLWITTLGLIRDEIKPINQDFIYRHFHKTLMIDELVYPQMLDVPNSITLLLCTMAIGKAQKIIIFGLDGYNGKYEDNINSFYKPELHKQERLLAVGSIQASGVPRDTSDFNNRFIKIFKEYCKNYNINPPLMVNCSPNSVYTVIPKISYEESIKWLEQPLTN